MYDLQPATAGNAVLSGTFFQWRFETSGSIFGKVPSRDETIISYKLHLLIAINGFIQNFELAPAHELLLEFTDLQVLIERANINAEKSAQL